MTEVLYPGPATCRVCGRPLHDTGRASYDRRLCYEHDTAQRKAIDSADQRKRRHGTTAPAVRFDPVAAHWLHDTWNLVQLAEGRLRVQERDDKDVVELLDALSELHREVDRALAPVREALRLRPSSKPPHP